jgi:hypothetical protein
VLGFQHRREAEQLLADLKERFKRFGLELHPEKTRLLEFGRFAAERRRLRGDGKPETFKFLGFTHSCGVKRMTRTFMVKRKTAKKRMRVRLQVIKAVLSKRRHEPVHRQAEWLVRVVRGYFAYHAIPGQPSCDEVVPYPGGPLLVQGAATPQPTDALNLGPVRSSRESTSSARSGSASLPH